MAHFFYSYDEAWPISASEWNNHQSSWNRENKKVTSYIRYKKHHKIYVVCAWLCLSNKCITRRYSRVKAIYTSHKMSQRGDYSSVFIQSMEQLKIIAADLIYLIFIFFTFLIWEIFKWDAFFTIPRLNCCNVAFLTSKPFSHRQKNTHQPALFLRWTM